MLMQFDPFREFDRLAEQLAAAARTPRPFPMDAYRRGDEFVVSFDLPGMAPGAIDLTVEQNVLTIKAERRFDGQEGDEVIAAERPHGAFTRQLFLRETLDAERLVASYETGVLILRIPVAESAKPRQVPITEGVAMTRIERDQAALRRGELARDRGARRLSLAIDARRRLNTPTADGAPDQRRPDTVRAATLRVPDAVARLQRPADAAFG